MLRQPQFLARCSVVWSSTNRALKRWAECIRLWDLILLHQLVRVWPQTCKHSGREALKHLELQALWSISKSNFTRNITKVKTQELHKSLKQSNTLCRREAEARGIFALPHTAWISSVISSCIWSTHVPCFTYSVCERDVVCLHNSTYII
jgi:hypothetical protein